MLSIADVEKKLAEEDAKKQAAAKAKVAAANGDKQKQTANGTNTEELDEKKATANAKLQESQRNAQESLLKIKAFDEKIEKIKKIKNPAEEVKKELAALQEKRVNEFNIWISENANIKGIEKALEAAKTESIDDIVHKLSQKLLSKRLEDDMQRELDQLRSIGEITKEKYDQMRAVIRGHKTVEITEAAILVNAVSQIDIRLKKYINDQTKAITSDIDENANRALSSLDGIMSKEKRTYNTLKKLSSSLKNYEAMSEKDAALAVTNSISDSLDKYTNLDSFFKNIDSSIEKHTGAVVNTKVLLSPILSQINTDIGNKVSSTLQPIIKQHVKTIEKITTKIATIQARILAAEKAFKAAVQRYQDLAKNFIQEQTKQLGEKISKELGINLTGALNGVKLKI